MRISDWSSDVCSSDLLVTETIASADPMEAFDGTDYALLVGARPRGPGMERKDLLEANAKIFSLQRTSLPEKPSPADKMLVVGEDLKSTRLNSTHNELLVFPLLL